VGRRINIADIANFGSAMETRVRPRHLRCHPNLARWFGEGDERPTLRIASANIEALSDG